jgi:hypothetical protein
MSRRLARMNDLERVHRIYMHEAVAPFLGYDPMQIETFRPIFEDFVASGTFYAYEVDGELAGFYKVTRFEGRASHVAQWAHWRQRLSATARA